MTAYFKRETRDIYHAKSTLELNTRLIEIIDDRVVYYGITPAEWYAICFSSPLLNANKVWSQTRKLGLVK